MAMYGASPFSRTADEASKDSVFYPPSDDYEGILLAGEAAEQNGGGVVQLKPIAYQLTGAIPLRKNVVYRGVAAPWRMSSGSVELSELDGGTRLIGNATLVNGVYTGGTFNAFEHNPTDKAAPYATGDELKNSELFGAGVYDLIIEQCKNGVKAGALYEGGCAHFRMDNVVAIRCSEWGFWLENCDAPQIGTVIAMWNEGGQFSYIGSGASGASDAWNYGDGHIKAIFAQAPRGTGNHMRSYGIRFRARGVRGDINDLMVSHIGINGLNTTYTATATITSGSPDIAVPDISQFGVDSAVYFQSTVGEFVTPRVYFVTQVSGASGAGAIRLSKDLGGTVITPTSSGTPTIVNHGYSLVEVCGYGSEGSGSGKITYCTFPHIDAESNGTAGIVMQRTTGTRLRSNSGVSNRGIVLREVSQYNSVHVETSTNVLDVDYGSQKCTLTGVRPQASKLPWQMPVGIVWDDTVSSMALYLAGSGSSTPTLYVNQTSFESMRFGRNLGFLHQAQSGAMTPNTGQAITVLTSGATVTLPAITDAMLGLVWFISNPHSASATVASSSSQTFDNIGGTTTSTLAANSADMFIAHKTGTTFYWARY